MRLTLLLLLAVVFPSGWAHEVRPAYLELKETAPGQFSVLWRTPVLSGMRLPVALELPEGVRDTRPAAVHELADSLLERRWIDAGPQGLAGRRIALSGLQFTITDALVRVELLDGRSWSTLVRPQQPWLEIAASPSGWEVAGTYLRLGVEHILGGVDHLLFVLALMLLVTGCKRLVATITAFTVAHSITLAAATLGLISVPVPPVEACIALSIVFVAAEVVRARRGEPGLGQRWPWLVAFAFGLLHGLGFASALHEAGLPQNAIPLALAFFNVGVELGQLAFIAVALAAFAGGARLLSRLRWSWPARAASLPAYAIGSVAAFWTLQRIATF